MPFQFVARGKLTGFNPSSDGTVVFAKIACELGMRDRANLKREDREGPLDVVVPNALASKLAPGVMLEISGHFITFVREWENPTTRQKKVFDHLRFEAEKIEIVKAA